MTLAPCLPVLEPPRNLLTSTGRVIIAYEPLEGALALRRYYVAEDWTPKKLEVLVDVPEHLDVTHLRATGPQPHEQLQPDVAQPVDGGAAADEIAADGHASTSKPQPDPDVVAALTGMGFSDNGSKRAALATQVCCPSLLDLLSAHICNRISQLAKPPLPLVWEGGWLHLPLYYTNSPWHLLNNLLQAPSELRAHSGLGDLSGIETVHAETREDFSSIKKSCGGWHRMQAPRHPWSGYLPTWKMQTLMTRSPTQQTYPATMLVRLPQLQILSLS